MPERQRWCVPSSDTCLCPSPLPYSVLPSWSLRFPECPLWLMSSRCPPLLFPQRHLRGDRGAPLNSFPHLRNHDANDVVASKNSRVWREGEKTNLGFLWSHRRTCLIWHVPFRPGPMWWQIRLRCRFWGILVSSSLSDLQNYNKKKKASVGNKSNGAETAF